MLEATGIKPVITDNKACLVLYSGGLDSILACRVLQEQGVRVTAVQFITPFFGGSLKGREGNHVRAVFEKYGITLEVVDISDEYLKMLKKPPHGYGKYMNPCIDCKILMIRNAVRLLNRFGASFIATGEVLGQRPMSQRRDALGVIERDSGANGLLVRPLSALHFSATDAERAGLIDRRRLLSIAGRGRKEQIALAERYGIEGYPAPAGGCVLADPIISRRLKRLFRLYPAMDAGDCVLARVGRHFILPDNSWLVVGRNQRENTRILSMWRENDRVLELDGGPGPSVLWRYVSKPLEAMNLAAGILCRYARLKEEPGRVRFSGFKSEEDVIIETMSVGQEIVEEYRI